MSVLREQIKTILSYKLSLGMSKREVLQGLIFTALQHLNIEPAIAQSAFESAVYNLKGAKLKEQQDKMREELRAMYDDNHLRHIAQ